MNVNFISKARFQPLSDVQNEKEKKKVLGKAFNLIFVSIMSQEYTIKKKKITQYSLSNSSHISSNHSFLWT